MSDRDTPAKPTLSDRIDEAFMTVFGEAGMNPMLEDDPERAADEWEKDLQESAEIRRKKGLPV